jgi:hypothetical protein
MALALYDRVQETTATTGTGTITLAGAVSGYQSFAVVGNGNTTYYCITSGAAWEVGIGTYSTTGPTLARTTVFSNSAGNTSPISLTGTSTVFVTYPSERSVNQDATGIVSVPTLYATASTTASSTAGAIAYGTLGYSDSNILASFASSQNAYNQMVLQNTNAGAAASTNFNVSNNNATSTTNFGEFGINSSGFTGTGAFSAAGATYLASASTDLAIGTYGSNPIHFVVNSGATDALTISTAGNVTTPNILTGAEVVASNGLYVNSQTVSASYAIPSGSSAMSAGPITVASGVTVTVPTGSRWVVL